MTGPLGPNHVPTPPKVVRTLKLMKSHMVSPPDVVAHTVVPYGGHSPYRVVDGRETDTFAVEVKFP